jgi:septum formation protein
MKPLQCLNGKKVILASGSPRRRELLTKLGIEFECIPSRFPETLDKSQFQTPCDYVIENARQKGLEVVDRIKSEGGRELPDLVISADTVVVTLDGQILEKPSNHQDAYQMLKSLCGIKHSVVSGILHHTLWFFNITFI